MNEFGAYLGTATVIYSKASSAARAIKDYNMAQIDNRPMKVQYALTPTTNPQTAQANNTYILNNRQPGIRRNDNRINKSGRGRTLNVMGRGRQQ